MLTRAAGRSLRHLFLTVASSISLFIAACGGGGGDGTVGSGTAIGSQSCDPSSCGTVLINMMDADGDFLSYTVDVVSLTLKRANGAVVETLPVRPRIDFTDIVDLKELLTAATVPGGDYVSGTLRLDYSNADIEVDVGGAPVKATPVDANGQPLTTMDLEIQLDNRRHLAVMPGRPALLELDFDLDASNTVNLASNPLQVTVQPFIVAAVDVADSREGRVRGPLVVVDTAASNYRIDLRPFNHPTARLGTFTVHTNSNTMFEIDGATFTGAAGLAALAGLAAGAPTAAFGAFSTSDHQFTAARVNAGSSVQSAQFDAVVGNVTARSGNQLTVRGATLIRRTGSFTFVRGDVTVTVGANTKVTKAGQLGNQFGIEAISVGQRINIFGAATESANGVSVDATHGRVRLQLTHLIGSVQSVVAGTLSFNLQSIERRRISIFNFAGTGATAAQDADPTHYEIATGNLNLSSIVAGVPAQVFGFVTPFGTAPPDFEGRTFVDYREARANLVVGWGLTGTSAPFTAADGSGIVIDTTNTSIGARHFIAIGPVLTDIKSLATPPRIVPDTTRDGIFAIGEPLRVQVFTSFADFTAALNTKLGGGQKLIGFSATGTFDAGTSQLTAVRVLATFKAQS